MTAFEIIKQSIIAELRNMPTPMDIVFLKIIKIAMDRTQEDLEKK
jgi:hypothetical protein